MCGNVETCVDNLTLSQLNKISCSSSVESENSQNEIVLAGNSEIFDDKVESSSEIFRV